MIGIRTGGVFSGEIDLPDLVHRVELVVQEMGMGENAGPPVNTNCISTELTGSKGGLVVIAGTFNHWGHDQAVKFCLKLSAEFGTEIMLMSWDNECDAVQCNMFLGGKPLLKTNEHPIGRVLRRLT